MTDEVTPQTQPSAPKKEEKAGEKWKLVIRVESAILSRRCAKFTPLPPNIPPKKKLPSISVRRRR